MVTSLALIFLVGLAAAALCRRIGLPRIIGMLLAGILLGPCALNALDPDLLTVSADLRQIALIIILLKAGLSLDLTELRAVGRPAAMLSCVPASCEILAFVLLAPVILGVSRVEAAVMGAVLAAVSPAVVVPRMVELMETRRGTDQGHPPDDHGRCLLRRRICHRAVLHLPGDGPGRHPPTCPLWRTSPSPSSWA